MKVGKTIAAFLIYSAFLFISINVALGHDIWDRLQRWRKDEREE